VMGAEATRCLAWPCRRLQRASRQRKVGRDRPWTRKRRKRRLDMGYVMRWQMPSIVHAYAQAQRTLGKAVPRASREQKDKTTQAQVGGRNNDAHQSGTRCWLARTGACNPTTLVDRGARSRSWRWCLVLGACTDRDSRQSTVTGVLDRSSRRGNNSLLNHSYTDEAPLWPVPAEIHTSTGTRTVVERSAMLTAKGIL
jgi:hypothetical protein